MRGENPTPRGESGRVAARVRELLGERGEPDRPDPLPPSGGPAPGWRRVLARLPVRMDPGIRAAVAVGVAVLVAAVVTGVWLMSSRPSAMAVSAAPSVPGSSPLTGTGAPSVSASGSGAGASGASGVPAVSAAVSASEAPVVVDVAGKVHHPGLYRLPPGARVDDAITAAGGPRAGVDLSSLNLAARVVDGQQIAVGVAPASQPQVAGGAPAGGTGAGAGATGPASAGAPTTPVDLNTATLDQLETLPGVGPVLAQHILDYRTQHGSFRTVDQLNDVSGIGDVKYAALKPLVTV